MKSKFIPDQHDPSAGIFDSAGAELYASLLPFGLNAAGDPFFDTPADVFPAQPLSSQGVAPTGDQIDLGDAIVASVQEGNAGHGMPDDAGLDVAAPASSGGIATVAISSAPATSGPAPAILAQGSMAEHVAQASFASLVGGASEAEAHAGNQIPTFHFDINAGGTADGVGAAVTAPLVDFAAAAFAPVALTHMASATQQSQGAITNASVGPQGATAAQVRRPWMRAD
jgi:hypothetical protein